jgi:hypothetical protein
MQWKRRWNIGLEQNYNMEGATLVQSKRDTFFGRTLARVVELVSHYLVWHHCIHNTILLGGILNYRDSFTFLEFVILTAMVIESSVFYIPDDRIVHYNCWHWSCSGVLAPSCLWYFACVSVEYSVAIFGVHYTLLLVSVIAWGTMQAGRSQVPFPGLLNFFNLPHPSSRTMAFGSSHL